MKPILLAAAIVLAACGRPSPETASAGEPQNPRAPVPAESTVVAGPSTGADDGPAASDTSRIARLEREARAIARTDGCTEGQCRTAPVGHRPCGGPRTYLAYCAATTDSAALFAKLDELARAEDEHNKQNETMSTCEFREPPATKLENGRCVAAPGVGGASIQ